MSKPPSGLFSGTKGGRAFFGDAESVIAGRVAGLDLREHPVSQRQLSVKSRKIIARKIEARTATREEYGRYMWDKRFAKRRKEGVEDFWAHERERIAHGKRPTRNWSDEQISAIAGKRSVKHNGKTVHAHHTYSVTLYPHLANRGEVIYPATPDEHLRGWHGGSYKKSLPGKRIRRIREF